MASLARGLAALPRSRFSTHVHHFERVDSSNQVARRLGRDGAPDGTLVVADEQTAGRGRRQRRWVSPPGAGLYVSLLLRPRSAPPESGAAVQLIAGVAVAELLQALLPTPPALRWPNDCYVSDRKIAGVLVEAETSGEGFDFLVCGIGSNVNHAVEDFPEDLRESATSLRLQVGHETPLIGVLGGLLDSFDLWEGAWQSYGLAPVRQRWLELSPETQHGRVGVQTDAGLLEGTADGLTDDGRLRVRTADGVQVLAAGEVVRLRPG
jgi:BirA family biotin operon repressor/biotin-[acetyl-CoA-carboxylase] ligase